MKTRIAIVALALGLALSLLINIFVLVQLLQFRAGALDTIVAARASLRRFGTQPITTVVQVDQMLPLSLTLPIDESFTVPVDTTYALNTVVNTTIRIPLLGPQNIAVPIQGEVPLQLTLEVPVRMTVPLSTTYHLAVNLPVQVSLPSDVLDSLDAALQQAEDSLR